MTSLSAPAGRRSAADITLMSRPALNTTSIAFFASATGSSDSRPPTALRLSSQAALHVANRKVAIFEVARQE